MNNQTISRILFLVLTIVLLIPAFTNKAYAAEESLSDEAPSQSIPSTFTISPPIFELKANPGDKLEEAVDIYNNGQSDLVIEVTTQNLKSYGEQGQIQTTDPEDEDALPSLADWITVDRNKISISAGQKETVKYLIDVPSNAQPGGHFASVLFGTISSTPDSTGALIAQKIASLVLLTVAGDIKEDATVEVFQPEKSVLYKNQKIKFSLKIKNNGNVYIRPRGYLVIQNVFGQKTDEIQIDGKNILPGATRIIPLEYTTKKMFGPYTASLNLIYGTKNQTLNASTGFTVIPLWQTIVIFVVLALIFVLRRRLWLALKVLFGRHKVSL